MVRVGSRWATFHLAAEQGSTDCVGPVKVAVRPERIPIEPYEATGPNRVPAMVERLVFLGSSTQVIMRLAHGQTVQALLQNHGGPPAYQQGTAVQVHLPADGLRVLPSVALAPVEDPPAARGRGARRPAGRASVHPAELSRPTHIPAMLVIASWRLLPRSPRVIHR